MGEALLIKAGSSGNSSRRTGLITEIFTSNTLWRVPEGIRNNQVSVRIFGGGGCGNGLFGGCGGFMNNKIINISSERDIFISIGDGGNITSNYALTGGVSSFGTYLSAIGGNTSFGSSGGGVVYTSSYIIYNAGSGRQFGGGGGFNCNGGNGGKWGGGGGSSRFSGNNGISGHGGCLYENASNPYEITGYSGLAGNGGNSNINAENGINTIGLGLEFEGAGLSGICNGDSKICGGGGYGGNGGHAHTINFDSSCIGASGGGGGYGGNGGNGFVLSINNRFKSAACGGGGGYGADGGDGGAFSNNVPCSGGGGGYGKYGRGGDINNLDGGIAAGGSTHGNGGKGICIIQYYID